MPQTPNLPRSSNRRVQRLDPSLSSNHHDWTLHPATELNFCNTVEEAENPRTDMARLRLIAGADREAAKKIFSKVVTPTLFRIPDTLKCDRTFARDNEEAYYLDAMDIFLANEDTENLYVTNIPLLRRRLDSRLHCAFGRKPGYRAELFERRRLNIWLCHDAPENEHFSDAELSAVHPKTEDWYDEIYLPPALPIPCPFVFYYYHKEMRMAQLDPDLRDSERNERLSFCARKVKYVMAIAVWWLKVEHAGKAYIPEKKTIDVVERECGTVPFIAGKRTAAIIEHMRLAAQLPQQFQNWMCLRDGSMEASTFVFCVKGQAQVDHKLPKGEKFECDTYERKITRTRYGSAIFKRVSLMDRRLTVPDLDRVDGLLGLVQNRQWTAHGSLRVGDLLYHLLTLYRRTESRLGDAERGLDGKSRELDYLRRLLEDKDGDIRDLENRIRDMRWRLDDKERCLYDANRRLDEERRRVDELRTRDALRSHPVQQNSLVRYDDPYRADNIGRQDRRRDLNPYPTETGGPRITNDDGNGEGPPQSPDFSPERDDVDVNSAALPTEELDLTQSPHHERPSKSRLTLPPATTESVQSRPNSRPGTPSGHVRRGYPFFRTLPSGKGPWGVKVLSKRTHDELNADTPLTGTESEIATGMSGALSIVPPKRARTADGTSAGPSNAVNSSPDPISALANSDPVAKKLADRHPAHVALAMADKVRKQQAERDRDQDEEN